jgi:hypothetical protein
MFGFIIFGFIIPWILGLWLYRKQPKLILIMAPVGVTIAFMINEPGFNYFWEIVPKYNNASLASLPVNFGLYPVSASFMIYFVDKKSLNAYFGVLLFTSLTTGLEWIAVLQKKIIYLHGWNMWWTFGIYLLAYSIVYAYYRILKKHSSISGFF